MIPYSLCLSLSDIPSSITQVHPCCWKWQDFILFLWLSSIPLHIYTRLPWWFGVKNPPANAGDVGLIPGSGRSPGERNGNPFQDSYLRNPMGRGAWSATVPGVAKSRAPLSDFTFTFHFHALEKEMATHPSVLAWRIPGMVEPGGLPPMGLHRDGDDWRDLAAAA